MKWIRFSVLISLSVGIITPAVQGQQIIYVDAGANGGNDGTSWLNAYNDLQNALQSALDGDEVWVARGIYKPVVPANPNSVTIEEQAASFRINDGVALYGGFFGNEVNRDDRNPEAYATILSGDLLNNDNDIVETTEPTRSDNTWRVLLMGDVDGKSVYDTTVLDGVTITGGNAAPPPLNPADSGGGLYMLGTESALSTPHIQNVRFEANSASYGGGLGCVFSRPTLLNVDFINNFAAFDGGGMSTIVCGPELRNVRFENNTAVSFGGGLINNRGASVLAEVSFTGNRASFGGGVYNLLDRSLLLNTFFASNIATVSGGGMYNDESPSTIMNAVFTGNQALDPGRHGGGGVTNWREVPYLTNVVFYGNTSRHDGGAILNINSDPFIINSILWNNHADGQEDELFSGGTLGSNPLVAATIIEGGVPLTATNRGGNLDQDPFFVDPDGADNIAGTLDDDFRLLPGSPAIDTGLNSAILFDALDLDGDGDTLELTPIDSDGNARVHNGNGAVFTIDIGAYEYGAPAVIVAIETDLAEFPMVPTLLEAYPNPFRSQATIRYELPRSGRVVLKVYDMLGREVASVLDSELPAGMHEAHFYPQNLTSGLYLFHLDIAGNRITKKMMLVN